MRLIIRQKAADDLDAIYEWIAKDSPASARRVVVALLDRMECVLLPQLANIGRPGRRNGTRELVEWPYIIIYKVNNSRTIATVVAVVHGARNHD